jgi:OOP family OmpA-OmpF porin
MEDHEITGIGTWTPGDVATVEGRATVNYHGKQQKITRIISTREYNYMMPQILFADANFLNQHREYTDTLLRCIVRSNDKIKQDRSYFENRVAALNAVVFNVAGRGPSFWAKFFYGDTQNGVNLGGSRVNSLAEMRHLFGLDQGVSLEQSVYGITYYDHAKRLKALMPERLPEIVPVADVVDLSFIKGMTGEQTASTTYTPKYDSSNQGSTFVNANFNIVFDTGSSVVKPTQENLQALNEIFNTMTRAGNTKVLIEGHTDNAGDAAGNMKLSQARALSVWQTLKQMDRSGIITEARLADQPQGYGPYRPIADNSTEEGKAKNRRVTIVLR